jgi:hypothetical protein
MDRKQGVFNNAKHFTVLVPELSYLPYLPSKEWLKKLCCLATPVPSVHEEAENLFGQCS